MSDLEPIKRLDDLDNSDIAFQDGATTCVLYKDNERYKCYEDVSESWCMRKAQELYGEGVDAYSMKTSSCY